MAVLNPSFEDAGSLPGEAAHWTLTAVTTLETLAGFGVDPAEGKEDFELWGERLASLDDVLVTRAFFDAATLGYEAFENGWANAVYLQELPPALAVVCPFGGSDAEAFAMGWNNVPYVRDWALLLASAATFGGDALEDFEEAWRGNETYFRKWHELVSSDARFDAGTEPTEAFEGAWAQATTL